MMRSQPPTVPAISRSIGSPGSSARNRSTSGWSSSIWASQMVLPATAILATGDLSPPSEVRDGNFDRSSLAAEQQVARGQHGAGRNQEAGDQQCVAVGGV